MNRDVLMPLLLEAVSQDNILPLTSTCNANCIFCSNQQNPPGTRAFRFPPLDEDLLDELLSFLDRERKIVIGESSSRLCEGEPFTHPRFISVLEKLRALYPETPVQVTTNGMLLDGKSIAKLREIEGRSSHARGEGSLLELVISLNCISNRQRFDIMGDRSPDRTLEGIWALHKSGIVFHGSVVAVPHITGWEELTGTLRFLERAGAKTTRVFLPGFTRIASENLQFPAGLWEHIHTVLEVIRDELKHPVTMEPPLKKKLEARVEGVIYGSPAWQAGIQWKNIIQSVDGEPTLTAADAFYRIQEAASPFIGLQCTGPEGVFSVSRIVEKKPGEASGLVIARDLEPGDLEAVALEIERSGSLNPLLMTSSLSEPLWNSAREEGLLPGELVVRAVTSCFFGGTIACAGLLTVSDFREKLKYVMQEQKPHDHDLVMIPLKAFDRKGFDLRGEHYRELVSNFPHVTISFL